MSGNTNSPAKINGQQNKTPVTRVTASDQRRNSLKKLQKLIESTHCTCFTALHRTASLYHATMGPLQLQMIRQTDFES